MQIDVTVISDSEPERLAAPPRRTALKQDKGKAKAQIDDPWTLPSPAQRPRPASISSATSSISSSSRSSAVKPRVPKASKSSFTSASKLFKSQEKHRALKEAAVASPVASTSQAVDSYLSSDDDLPPPLDFALAGSSKQIEASPAHQSAEESQEESPRGAFARTLSSRFAYEPSTKSAASANNKKPNYFKKSDTSASDSSTSRAPIASTSKQIPGKQKEAIPLPLIALLEDCPVCSVKWTTKKSSPVKLSHILKCAATQEWEIATVLKVIKKHIQSLKAAQDEKKRELEEERTLFEGVVGGKRVNVNVVGVDSGALMVPRTQGGSIQVEGSEEAARATTYAVEDELAEQKKKLNKAKSASANPKLAKALKILEKDPLPTQTQSSTKSTKSTLKTYDQSKPVIQKRAKDLMDTYYGSGLTQVPIDPSHCQTRAASSKIVIDVDALDDTSMDIDDILPVVGKTAKPKAASVPILAPTPLGKMNQLNEAYKVASALYEPGSILMAAQKASSSNAGSRLWDLASCEEDVTDRANKPSSLSTSSTLNFTSSKPFIRDNSSKDGFLKPTQPVEQRAVSAKKKTSDPVPSTSKKPAKATKGKAAAVPEPERAPTSDRSKMPDYSTWTIEQLQKQSGKFGYKVSVERSVNITRLEQVWDALHPLKVSNAAKTPAKTNKTKTKPKAKAVNNPVSEESSDDTPLADIPASPRKRAAAAKPKDPVARKKKAIASAVSRRSSEAEAEEGGRSAGEFMEDETEVVAVKSTSKRKVKDKVQEVADFHMEMRKLVLKDPVLWHRILRYEPVLFDDFLALAETKDLKATSIGMRNFLDAMQISFYMDQTKGRNADGGRGRTRKKKVAAK